MGNVMYCHTDIIAAYQGAGYGMVLINRMLNALKQSGSIGVHLIQHKDNLRAFKFYTEKFGFIVIATLDTELVLGKML